MSTPTEAEQALLKANIENQMRDHYEKVIDGMVRWCIFEQEESLDTVMKAFGIDPKIITIEILEKILAKYKEPLNDSGNK